MMFRRREPPVPPPHVHTWISVSSSNKYQQVNTHRVTGEQIGKGQPITLILQRCKCGLHTTTTIDGEWSREELGIDDRVVADLMDLLHETTPEEPT